MAPPYYSLRSLRLFRFEHAEQEALPSNRTWPALCIRMNRFLTSKRHRHGEATRYFSRRFDKRRFCRETTFQHQHRLATHS
jgi:hypothetical protein